MWPIPILIVLFYMYMYVLYVMIILINYLWCMYMFMYMRASGNFHLFVSQNNFFISLFLANFVNGLRLKRGRRFNRVD